MVDAFNKSIDVPPRPTVADLAAWLVGSLRKSLELARELDRAWLVDETQRKEAEEAIRIRVSIALKAADRLADAVGQKV
jgi:hypothetical protein